MTTIVCIKRVGGIVVQDCDIYIGRSCSRAGWNLSQSKWHNPFTSTKYSNMAIVLYESYIRQSPLINDIEQLRGKILGCWCKPNTCHGDILIKILNERFPSA